MVMNALIGMENFYLFSVRYVHGTSTRPVALLYGNRLEAQIVYRDEPDRLAAETPTRVLHVIGEPPEGCASQWHYLLCGPPPMIAAAEAALKTRGIPRAQVSAERFRYD